MMTWIRLAWRLNRMELAVLGGAALFVSVALAWLAWRASTIIGMDPTCFYHGNPGVVPSDSPSCQALNLLFSDQMRWERTLNLGVAATAAPFVLGILLGAPIVAREIDHKTAGLAWSLARSRTRWLIHRLLPIATFLVVALVVLGLVGSWFDDARFSTGFWREYDPWPLLVSRGLLTFALGVALGALVGRGLPAVLLTAFACAIFLSIGAVMDLWMEAEAVPIAVTDERGSLGASRIFDMAYRDDATGQLTSVNEYLGVPEGQAVMAADDVAGLTMVGFQVPASRHLDFVLRESALTGVLALGVVGLAFVVVSRRRPY